MKLGKIHNGEDLSIYAGNKENNNSNNTAKDRKDIENKKSGSVFAGDLNLSGQYNAIMKKIRAEKQAMKIVLNQFKKDQKVDSNLTQRLQHQDKLSQEGLEAQTQINKLTDMKKQLKDAYHITDDSNEQKNLELIEKSLSSGSELTAEEMDQLSKNGPLTEYQKSALQYDTMQNIWQKRFDDANLIKFNEGRTIDSIKVERLKSHEMIDCQKEAAEIIEEIMKEVLGTLYEEAKDQIDEKVENQDDKNKDSNNQEGSIINKAENKENQKMTSNSQSNKNNIQNNKNNTQNNIKYSYSNDRSELSINNKEENLTKKLQEADIDLKKFQEEVKYKVRKNELYQELLKGISVNALL